MKGWPQVPLGDVADITVGFVGTMARHYEDGGVRFLRSQNVLPHRLDLTDIKYISPDFDQRIEKSRLHAGDVVTVRTGKPGTTAVVPDWLGPANCSDLVITRPGPDLNAHWLSYYMNSSGAHAVSSALVGAVQQHFNVGSAKKMLLTLPPLPEQQAIAEVLGALDDKIAANTRLAATADELASTLVKAALTDERTPLSELADVVMGSSPRGDDLNESGEGTPFYQGVRDFGLRFPTRRVSTTAPVRSAAAGDLLVSVRAPVGELNLADEDLCIGRGLAAVRSTHGHQATLFHQLRSDRAAWQPFESEGTVFASINKAQLHGLRLRTVAPGTASELEANVSVLEAKIGTLIRESRTLAAARDALLPVLMTGTLRVNDVGRTIETIM